MKTRSIGPVDLSQDRPAQPAQQVNAHRYSIGIERPEKAASLSYPVVGRYDATTIRSRRARPTVALESTVYSTFGLPSSHGLAALAASLKKIEEQGASGLVTGIVAGRATIGMTQEQILHREARKVGAADLAVAMAQRWPIGVTTVSASLTLAHSAGISVLATGGIGGVHKNATSTGDVSGDLAMLAKHPIATVCSGAKAFLDLPRTLEMLETLGVAVVGYQTSELPMFTALGSGLALAHRVDDIAEIAELLRYRKALSQGGIVVAVDPPAPMDAQELEKATVQARSEADEQQITSASRTPFILARVCELTNGASVEANSALVINNASVAAQIAVALADTQDHRPAPARRRATDAND